MIDIGNDRRPAAGEVVAWERLRRKKAHATIAANVLRPASGRRHSPASHVGQRACPEGPSREGYAGIIPQGRPTPPLPRADIVVDATGLRCPGPILRLAQAVKGAQVGEIIEVVGTDPGILADAPAWAMQTGHAIIGAYSDDGRHRFWFRKAHG